MTMKLYYWDGVVAMATSPERAIALTVRDAGPHLEELTRIQEALREELTRKPPQVFDKAIGFALFG